MENSGLMIVMSYPETVVMVADEWYSSYLKYFGIGKKDYVRAGHAALVLIDKSTGELEYHDFGRYITPEPFGRVRGKDTDCELDFPLKAELNGDEIVNLTKLLVFLATHPKLTHGDGRLIATVCTAIDYREARKHITDQQHKHFIRYAAFIKDASNCARFVTRALIASVTDEKIKRKLIASTRFTPSTVGNVLNSCTGNPIYEVSPLGEISELNQSLFTINRLCFLDKLEDYVPALIGTMYPKRVDSLHPHAQWLSGIAAGAWYELYETDMEMEYLFRRVSPHGNVDVHDRYLVENDLFDYSKKYDFIQYSNCSFFHILQGDVVYRFNRK
ncbi:DUF6695 family protein [Mangrovimonas aestuarii]|uniref:DUF6695 family protein n=1 Tax=Mangrovimonas aestuarii TaxID=3018443 RepID=UPI0023782800|nr:DUF6695 family protein [Mangrovimonas aestuarii]